MEIINKREENKFIVQKHFKMKGIPTSSTE
jgi:hypothetical protein